MPFVTSSILGVDFNTASTTALFALNSRALGSDNSEWVYVKATGTLIAGIVASVQAAGTAVAPTTGQLLAPTGVAGGGVLAVVQTTALQGEYVWAATRGQNLILACSGTVAPAAAATTPTHTKPVNDIALRMLAPVLLLVFFLIGVIADRN